MAACVKTECRVQISTKFVYLTITDKALLD